MPSLLEAPRFTDGVRRACNRDALTTAIESWLATHTRARKVI